MGIVSHFYKKTLVHRYDDLGFIHYFSAADFPGLKAEPFSFLSGKNTLRGSFYSYDGCREDVLLIFCHGIGGGRRSYMTEIERLCKEGYRVLAYDNTGCFESEGESTGCMNQSLADLDAAITRLKKDGLFQKYKAVYVMGHSWGGFAAANIPVFHPEIKKAVVISGFISVKNLLLGSIGEKNFVKKLIIKRILSFEYKNTAPDYYYANAVDSVKNKNTLFLFAHSTDDPSVSYKYNTGLLKETASGENTSFLKYDDKLHNPNYTLDAVTYMAKVFGDFNAAKKAGMLKTTREKKQFFSDTDWVRMTRQDEDFWEKVFSFLER